jgi:hypothetical protein
MPSRMRLVRVGGGCVHWAGLIRYMNRYFFNLLDVD